MQFISSLVSSNEIAAPLYCTVLFLGPDGDLLGKHRKLMPTAMERIIGGFGDGSTLTVLPTPLGRIGAVICWENYMPQLRLAMYAQGIDLYCAPTVDERETWLPTMRHIALEGRCFVLSANQYALGSDYPTDYPVEADDPGAVLIHGGSCIVDPFGQVLAGPARDGETLLTADLDLDEIARGAFDLDVVGHYARPDVFRLVVNETAQAPVSWESGEDDAHELGRDRVPVTAANLGAAISTDEPPAARGVPFERAGRRGDDQTA